MSKHTEKTVTSKLGGTMNTLAQEIKDVSVIHLGETLYDGEIITIEFNNGTIKYINTATNVISNSYKQVRKKKHSNCKLQNGRLTTVLYVGGYIHGTRIQLGTLVGLAKDFLYDEVPDSYIGHSINHIDRTGNITVYGYINNKMYNIETTSDSNNSRQWRCVQRIQELMGVHIGLSANEEELLHLIEFEEDEPLKKKLIEHYFFKDNNGTEYLQYTEGNNK